jgi:hypothetical protein
MPARRAQTFFASAVIVRQYPLPAVYAFEVYHGLTMPPDNYYRLTFSAVNQ